jgi:hypothetical protein
VRCLFLRRKVAIEERAKRIARMVTLIVHSLQTKSYDDFVESFSNPDGEPTPFERLNQQLHFQMRISPTCWYDAITEYPCSGTPFFRIEGGGDDFGVLISGDAIPDRLVGVDLWVPTNSQAGRDARAVAHALQGMPGWASFSDIEVATFATHRASSQ